MAWIIVIAGTDKGKTLQIKSEEAIIGRDGTRCSLVISDEKASRFHARIWLYNGYYQIEDLGSTNGTYLEGKKLDKPDVLKSGNVISVGNTKIKFEEETENEKPIMTHRLFSGDYYEPAGGCTRALQVSKKTISIGRDPSNDLALDHPMVSRRHAKIVLQGEKHLIYDLDSANGTYVNGRRVSGSEELLPASLVQICGYRYFFDGQTLIEYDENAGRLRVELKKLGKTVKLPSGETRELLKDINIIIQPRQFVAILGGSGAGKSTLMGAMSGMIPATSGEILINGRNLYKEYYSFRSMIGFVPQDDIVYRELTAKEVLTYSARLRMPGDASTDEITALVDKVMSDLELAGKGDVLVDSLSGGQRKRVSIGVELLTKPSLFFLDEPTSGLDPGLEKMMMELLRKLADQGHTIVLVTHATFNIKLCDKVVFLTEGGRLAFFGTPAEALEYFEVDDFADIYKKIATEKTPREWAQKYSRSHVFINQAVEGNGTPVVGGGVQGPVSGKSKTSLFRQWCILTRRYAHIMGRDRKNLSILLLQAVVIPLLIVMVFHHSAPLFENSRYNTGDLKITQEVIASGQLDQVQQKTRQETKRRGNISLCIALMIFSAIWLGASNSAREIIKELPIYRRERLVNLRIAPYLMSKVAVLSVLCLIQSLLLVTIVHLGLCLPSPASIFAAIYLVSLASVMMGLTVSALASNVDKALASVPLILVPQIILSGALVPIADVRPEAFKYIFYLAISKWGYELAGGGISDINSRVALDTPLQQFTGYFTWHWAVLSGYVLVLYIVTTFAVKRKDRLAG